MRQSSPSLPSLGDGGGRGRGLADLQGRDPMDRRLEQEKKERYAQALREQRETGQCGSSPPISPPPRSMPMAGSSDSGAWGTADKVAQVQDLMRQRIQALHEEQQRMFQHVMNALAEQQGNAAAAAEKAAGRSVEAAVAQALERAINTARQECESLVKRNSGAAGDELDRLRRAVEASQGNIANYSDTIADHEARIRRLEQYQDEWARDRADILREQKSASDSIATLQSQLLDVARQAAEVSSLSAAQAEMRSQLQDIARQAAEVKHIAASQEELRSQLARVAQQAAEIEHVAATQEEMRLQLARVAQQAAEVEHVAATQEKFRSQLADIKGQLGEVDRIAASQAICAKNLEKLQHEYRAVGEEVARLREAHGDMAHQIAEMPRLMQKLQRLEEEMPRLAARAAREAVANVKLPAPELPPKPPEPSFAKVSAAAFAVLKNESELHELHGLQNVVGRAGTCDACIPGSQAVSNRHASIDFDNEGNTSLRDLGSRNGTFLNDRRVPQDERGFVLQSGDAIKLGIDGPVFMFEYGPAAFSRWPQDPQRAVGIRREPSAAGHEVEKPGRAASGERRRAADRSPARVAKAAR